MTNHFRTKLMNIADEGTKADYISPEFGPVSLNSTLSSFRDLLFPSEDRDDIVARANAYTILLTSAGLEDVITKYDSRITYDTTDLYNFQNVSVDLVGLASEVINNSVTDSMIRYGDQHAKYQSMYESSPFAMQKLAAAIASYSYKLN
jgi:hypothetical protein